MYKMLFLVDSGKIFRVNEYRKTISFTIYDDDKISIRPINNEKY
jgi:hypothetical protein